MGFGADFQFSYSPSFSLKPHPPLKAPTHSRCPPSEHQRPKAAPRPTPTPRSTLGSTRPSTSAAPRCPGFAEARSPMAWEGLRRMRFTRKGGRIELKTCGSLRHPGRFFWAVTRKGGVWLVAKRPTHHPMTLPVRAESGRSKDPARHENPSKPVCCIACDLFRRLSVFPVRSGWDGPFREVPWDGPRSRGLWDGAGFFQRNLDWTGF